MTRIISDSKSSQYEFEIEFRKEDKSGKTYLTLYKDDIADAHLVILYTFQEEVPIIITNVSDDYKEFIRQIVSSKCDNLFRLQYPPAVIEYLKTLGEKSNEIWGKTVYEVVNEKPYLLLTYINGNSFVDESVTVSEAFLIENRSLGIDVTNQYINYFNLKDQTY